MKRKEGEEGLQGEGGKGLGGGREGRREREREREREKERERGIEGASNRGRRGSMGGGSEGTRERGEGGREGRERERERQGGKEWGEGERGKVRLRQVLSAVLIIVCSAVGQSPMKLFGRKGLRRAGERLAKGWRRVGTGLAKGWRVSLHHPVFFA